jgi:hypothetical protein
MTLDDVYGPELDRFPLEQERIAAPPTLEWDEIRLERIAPRMVDPQRTADAPLGFPT